MEGCPIHPNRVRLTKALNNHTHWKSVRERLKGRSIQPKFPEISVQNWSVDRFGPTRKVSKKRVHGRFPFIKNSGLKFRKLHVLSGTVHSGCTDPIQATARFVIVASQHTHNYALKEKSKYCLYPKEHSTVEKGRWKTKGGGILFRVESLWMQVKVKNSCELKRYVSQNIRTIWSASNSWNCTVNKFGVLANLYSARLSCIHFSLTDSLL